MADPNTETVSNWLMSNINSLGLLWHIDAIAYTNRPAVIFVFTAIGSHLVWSMNGIHDRLPPGWLTAAGRQAIHYVLEEQFS